MEIMMKKYISFFICVFRTELFRLKFFATQPQVPPLLHLARMAVRRRLHTQDVDGLPIPTSLKTYLKYESWN